MWPRSMPRWPGRNRGLPACLLMHVNARQQAGIAPLHETAQNGDFELTQLLLDHGADPSAVDDKGKTPAATAREHGHEAVAALLEKGSP